MSLIILYDQIPRNIFRGSAEAYKFDEKARNFAKELITEYT